MAEWFKAAVLKTVDGESRPWVRILLPPPVSPCEMIYHGWIIDYDTEKRMDIRANTLECDGTPSTKANRASKR